MEKLNKSPARNTFQKEKYLERQAEKGKTPDNDEDTRVMIKSYELWDTNKELREQDKKWRYNNLEYDLRSCDWICDKAKASRSYAQNLYAAMCNNAFQKNELWLILKEDMWSCTWRYAGGIIADMIEQGDYIDWYCSGIKGEDDPNDAYVGESVVTVEIENDLAKLGWSVVDKG